ncbi:EthD domain-containing protein [Sphingomonas sanxanigenens]|uniref:EthD domain-containing protein n=1 Tax=Sphingomonas sanxanigenens TaxID=397260 RepID=UPI001FE0FB54|nr:EthD domain-containing protein [Sphingomonas sanxanigenens]
MIKTIGFMPRRPDISRAQFREYYETRHAPLAVPLFPFIRYRRNHLADMEVEPGFDCISEFWVPSLNRIGELMAGEVGDTMRADERNFLDQPRIVAALADPVATGSDAGSVMVLLRNEGGDVDALVAAAREAGAGLDLLSPMDARPLPCDAVWRCDGAAGLLPTGWHVATALPVEARETEAQQLRASD